MFQKDLLQDRTILVTGGGTGLGKAMATRLSCLGANVVIAARNLERLQQAATEIESTSGRPVLAVACNVKDPAACQAAVDAAVARFGGLYGLVNNAAGNFLCAAEDLSPNGFDAVVDIVMKGTWHMTQAVGRRLIAQGQGGAVVSILTTYVHSGSAFVLPSAMAKTAVLAMTRSLATEWGTGYNIRLNAIAPGPFPTEGATAALVADPSMIESALNRIPLRRFGDPAELGDLCAYLMAPGSAYINGQCIDIDGGEMLYGAGEFNHYLGFDRDALKQLFGAMRSKKS